MNADIANGRKKFAQIFHWLENLYQLLSKLLKTSCAVDILNGSTKDGYFLRRKYE
jgi:hypothetical protein